MKNGSSPGKGWIPDTLSCQIGDESQEIEHIFEKQYMRTVDNE